MDVEGRAAIIFACMDDALNLDAPWHPEEIGERLLDLGRAFGLGVHNVESGWFARWASAREGGGAFAASDAHVTAMFRLEEAAEGLFRLHLGDDRYALIDVCAPVGAGRLANSLAVTAARTLWT